jgi:hypothetical protein
VATTQSCRQRGRVEWSSDTRDDQPSRQLRSVAQWAVKGCPDPLTPFPGCFDPSPFQKGRTMPDVLPVMALKLSHPVARLVSPEASDLALHPARQSEVRPECPASEMTRSQKQAPRACRPPAVRPRVERQPGSLLQDDDEQVSGFSEVFDRTLANASLGELGHLRFFPSCRGRHDLVAIGECEEVPLRHPARLVSSHYGVGVHRCR